MSYYLSDFNVNQKKLRTNIYALKIIVSSLNQTICNGLKIEIRLELKY